MKRLSRYHFQVYFALTIIFAISGSVVADVADYVAAVENDSPTAYWRFEESDTSQWVSNNLGNSTYDGSYKGGASLVSGIAGQSVSLNNSDAYISFDRFSGNVGAAMDGASAITIEAWIKNTDVPSGDNEDNVIFSTYIWSGRPGVVIRMKGQNIQVGGRSCGSEDLQEKTAGYTSTNEWHHIVGILDVGYDKIRIYIDGVKQDVGNESVSFGERRYTRSSTNNTSNIGVMDRGDGLEGCFNGLIDEVAIYRIALDDMDRDGVIDSENRVLAHFNAMPPAPEPTTISLLTAGALTALLKRRRKRVHEIT